MDQRSITLTRTQSRRHQTLWAVLIVAFGTGLAALLIVSVSQQDHAGAAQDAGLEPPTEFWLFGGASEAIGGLLGGQVGGGQWIDQQVSVNPLSPERVEVLINYSEIENANNSLPLLRVVFGARSGEALDVGIYLNARQSGFEGTPAPELQFERVRSPRSCDSFSMFEVLEISYDSGALVSFAADFQFSCNADGEGPWSTGSIRYNSSVPNDFEVDQDYPTLGGTVTGPDDAPLRGVLVCTGFKDQFLFDTLAGPPPGGGPAPCARTLSDGSYVIEVDLERTNDLLLGDGEFFLFYFPTEHMYLRQACTGSRNDVATNNCLEPMFINLTRGVYVNTQHNMQLPYGCWNQLATIVGDPAGGFVEGTDGDDVIVSFDADDLIVAGAGNDFICPGGGTNTVYAGDGDDHIGGGNQIDIVAGQAGDDYVWGGRGDDTIRGGDGNDELRGDAGNDNINGGRDDDAVFGDGGDDLLRGGTGDDFISAGSGADFAAGNGGVDEVLGEAGDDVLVSGGPRGDVVDGGEGNDLVKGLGGSDMVSGGPGDDDLRGGKGTDSLDGGDGADTCNGGEGYSDRSIQCETTINLTADD